MIGRAVTAGVPFAWFAADEEFGQDPGLRSYLEGEGIAYAMAVPKNTDTATGSIDAERTRWWQTPGLRERLRAEAAELQQQLGGRGVWRQARHSLGAPKPNYAQDRQRTLHADQNDLVRATRPHHHVRQAGFRQVRGA
jgi:hypothetical protein